jgi:hypothetical protein
MKLRLILVAVAILAAASAVYVLAFREKLPAVRYVAKTAPPTFTLASVEGDVQVQRQGNWVKVQPGDRLAATESIRTGDGAEAVIRDERGDELTLRERVELSVMALSQSMTELKLTRGKVKASPSASTEHFEIQAGSAQTVGPGGSRFTVYANDRGAVAVASEIGDVKVIAGGKTVTVGAKTKTTVEPGATPADPVPVGDGVFLSVAWPQGEVHATHLPVAGKTEAGAIVKINGREVVVRSDGTFLSDVALVDGKNPVQVDVESIDGTHKTDDRQVSAKTTVPLDADPSKLYDPPKKPHP